jgi:pyridoxamine 5'-phosphate oxidase
VRLEGPVERVAPEASDAYFTSRPRGSRIGAWASRQGSVLPDRHALEERFDALEAEWRGREIPRPPYWGGYVLRPVAIEFWEGRPSRLHDRIHYLLEGDAWREERLSP